MWDIQTFSFIRKTTPSNHYILKNNNIKIEFTQSSGSITITNCEEISYPKERNYFFSGLMNLPTSILDQWLSEIGAPTLNFILKNAEKIETHELIEKKFQLHAITKHVKTCLMDLEEKLKKSKIGTIFCCVNKSTGLFFTVFQPQVFSKYAEEKDSRDFAVSYSENRLEDLKNKFLEADCEILKTLEFVMEEEKYLKFFDTKMWFIKSFKL